VKITPSPSGGLFSTAGDLARFYRMLLNGGELDGVQILSADAVRAMTTVQTGDLETGFTAGNGWGYGVCIVREPQGVTRMLSPGTYGHGGAYGTQGWIDPAKGLIYVLMNPAAGSGEQRRVADARRFPVRCGCRVCAMKARITAETAEPRRDTYVACGLNLVLAVIDCFSAPLRDLCGDFQMMAMCDAFVK